MRRTASAPFAIAALILFMVESAADARHYAPLPACWSIHDIEDAKVMELSVSLNVLSLRCRHENAVITDRYERYTTDSTKVMAGVAHAIKAHFRGSNLAYDRYSIGLANKYGAGVTGQDCKGVATLMESAITNAGTLDGLSQVAEQDNIQPNLVGGACPEHPVKAFVVRRWRRR
ncbi:MAG: hypothetical protein KGQ42_02045 [Alphaproteobacteria bacterium]|nr:hypothetical protein [Alphaproteobacteria bacterium]MDE2041565.1 hypothetical protein [Alphaproteobacteria bacterium]MDE2341254.1 hypothetical protein [Alphaproteobacteria bacterium]